MGKRAKMRAAVKRMRRGQGVVSAVEFERLRSDIDFGKCEAHGFPGLTRLRMLLALDGMAASDDPDLYRVVRTRDVWELAKRAGVVEGV